MKMISRALLVVAALAGGVAVPARAQAVDLSTPEAAVRTYWRMQDALDSVAASILTGPAERDPFAAARRGYEQTLAGRAAEVLASPFVRQIYVRDVEAVDLAGPSRALVSAVVHNITPLPEGTLLTHEQEELRTEGQQFRYVVERDGDAWRITQIQRWDDLGSGWQDIFIEGLTAPVFARW
jgi:hypothetical protein